LPGAEDDNGAVKERCNVGLSLWGDKALQTALGESPVLHDGFIKKLAFVEKLPIFVYRNFIGASSRTDIALRARIFDNAIN
jgi:hypothetical protein